MQPESQNQQNEPQEAPSDVSLPQAELSGHVWVQRGTSLECTSCTFNHASFIPPEYQYIGPGKDGTPQFRKIEH